MWYVIKGWFSTWESQGFREVLNNDTISEKCENCRTLGLTTHEYRKYHKDEWWIGTSGGPSNLLTQSKEGKKKVRITFEYAKNFRKNHMNLLKYRFRIC